MLNLVFMPNAWQDLGWWMKNDIKAVKKMYSLLENACKTTLMVQDNPNH